MFNLSNDKIVSQKGKATKGPSAANSTAEKKVRKGKGTHGLNVIRALIDNSYTAGARDLWDLEATRGPRL